MEANAEVGTDIELAAADGHVFDAYMAAPGCAPRGAKVAETVAFLASARSSFTSGGSVICRRRLDGGHFEIAGNSDLGRPYPSVEKSEWI